MAGERRLIRPTHNPERNPSAKMTTLDLWTQAAGLFAGDDEVVRANGNARCWGTSTRTPRGEVGRSNTFVATSGLSELDRRHNPVVEREHGQKTPFRRPARRLHALRDLTLLFLGTTGMYRLAAQFA
jgi:hypothetical protein